MNLPYQLNQSECINKCDFENALNLAASAVAELREIYANDKLPLLKVPSWQHDLPEIEALATAVKNNFKRLVVLGTGGSSLGGRMLASLPPTTPIEIEFLENVDPHTVDVVLQKNIADSFFLIISKSGGTVETIAQALICIDAVAKANGKDAVKNQFAVITGNQDSPLIQAAASLGIKIIGHPDVGGRFSVLTSVGLIPAAVAGLDIKAIRNGAEMVIKNLISSQDTNNIMPAAGAAAVYALQKSGVSISVIMPYCDRLFEMGAWYRQLWAESLGKDGKGSTPVRALGVVDQHSQLQLYLDGPKDKLFSLICVDYAGKGRKIPDDIITDSRLDYLYGHRIGDVIAAEQIATSESLSSKNCPVRTFNLPAVNEVAFGALLMHFMLETIITAKLMQVNAFDQPAVEDGKERARKLLSKWKSL